MQNVSYKTNEEVLKIVQEEKTLMDTIRKRQMNWMGHVLRGNSLLKIVLEGRMEGKKTVGRPRITMMDWMMDKSANRGYKEIKELAQDGGAWRHWNPGPA